MENDMYYLIGDEIVELSSSKDIPPTWAEVNGSQAEPDNDFFGILV